MKTITNLLSNTISLAVIVGSIFVANLAFAQEVIADDSDVTYNSSIRGVNRDLFPEVYCMALNVYYESRGSNLADQYAVADVVLNRVEDTRYPNTICEVIRQGKKNSDGSLKRNACQFSWYCDGKSDVPRDEESWSRAQSIAWNIVMAKNYRGITEGSTHYHATYVNPSWTSSKPGFSITRVGRIGNHIFYRWN